MATEEVPPQLDGRHRRHEVAQSVGGVWRARVQRYPEEVEPRLALGVADSVERSAEVLGKLVARLARRAGQRHEQREGRARRNVDRWRFDARYVRWTSDIDYINRT